MPDERSIFANTMANLLESPVVWFIETIVEPNQKQYPWYHQKMQRVPTIDQCYMDDPCCQYESDMQFKRDKLVDNEIDDDYYLKAEDNWFSKYGDLGYYGTSLTAYVKQKHRMIWERRFRKKGQRRSKLKTYMTTLLDAMCVTNRIQEY